MTFLVSPSTPDIIYGTVIELLLLACNNKQIKTNSINLRHLIIEIPSQPSQIRHLSRTVQPLVAKGSLLGRYTLTKEHLLIGLVLFFPAIPPFLMNALEKKAFLKVM